MHGESHWLRNPSPWLPAIAPADIPAFSVVKITSSSVYNGQCVQNVLQYATYGTTCPPVVAIVGPSALLSNQSTVDAPGVVNLAMAHPVLAHVEDAHLSYFPYAPCGPVPSEQYLQTGYPGFRIIGQHDGDLYWVVRETGPGMCKAQLSAPLARGSATAGVDTIRAFSGLQPVAEDTDGLTVDNVHHLEGDDNAPCVIFYNPLRESPDYGGWELLAVDIGASGIWPTHSH